MFQTSDASLRPRPLGLTFSSRSMRSSSSSSSSSNHVFERNANLRENIPKYPLSYRPAERELSIPRSSDCRALMAPSSQRYLPVSGSITRSITGSISHTVIHLPSTVLYPAGFGDCTSRFMLKKHNLCKIACFVVLCRIPESTEHIAMSPSISKMKPCTASDKL